MVNKSIHTMLIITGIIFFQYCYAKRGSVRIKNQAGTNISME